MTKNSSELARLFTFHYECMQGMCFSEALPTSQGLLLFSAQITDPYSNFWVPVANTVTVTAEVIEEFHRRDRRLAVYAAPGSATESFITKGSFQYGPEMRGWWRRLITSITLGQQCPGYQWKQLGLISKTII